MTNERDTWIITLSLLKTQDSEFKDQIDSIDVSSPRGLVEINSLASEIFTTHSAFEKARNVLGNNETARQKVLRATVENNFPPKDTISEDLYSKLLDSAHQKEELSRQLIIEKLNAGAEFGLKPYELAVVRASCGIGIEYDELGLLWRNDVQVNPGNQQAKRLGLTDQYTVIVGSPEQGYRQVPWVNRYPDQVRAIADNLHNLANQLFSFKDEPEAQALGNYFAQYADAFEARTTDGHYSTEKVAEMWRNVDRAWIQIKGRTQPVASREYNYYDPNGIRVFPDFRLVIVEETSVEELAATRLAMREIMKDRYGGTRVYKETINALDKVRVYPGVDVIFAGSLDFQPAGQSLPNEQKVRDELGTKIILNPDAIAQRWQLSRKLARKVFSNPKDLESFDKIDLNIDMTARDFGGHEFGEPLYQSLDVHETLGQKTTVLLNEDLANLCATAALAGRIMSRELSSEDAYRHAISLLGTYLRYIDIARGIPHLNPYYVGLTLQGLRRMIGTGFIEQDELGKWNINPDKSSVLLEENLKDLDRLVQICERLDRADAEDYLNQAKETEQIKDIIRKINPEAKFKEA